MLFDGRRLFFFVCMSSTGWCCCCCWFLVCDIQFVTFNATTFINCECCWFSPPLLFHLGDRTATCIASHRKCVLCCLRSVSLSIHVLAHPYTTFFISFFTYDSCVDIFPFSYFSLFILLIWFSVACCIFGQRGMLLSDILEFTLRERFSFNFFPISF